MNKKTTYFILLIMFSGMILQSCGLQFVPQRERKQVREGITSKDTTFMRFVPIDASQVQHVEYVLNLGWDHPDTLAAQLISEKNSPRGGDFAEIYRKRIFGSYEGNQLSRLLVDTLCLAPGIFPGDSVFRDEFTPSGYLLTYHQHKRRDTDLGYKKTQIQVYVPAEEAWKISRLIYLLEADHRKNGYAMPRRRVTIGGFAMSLWLEQLE